jgi:type II secretory pathway pseudopilin PulG
MTLIELVIALGILAAVASVTLDMFESATEKSRYERTYSLGSSIKEAVDGTTTNDSISRFISDMGRLPVIINTSDKGKLLAELFDSSEVDNQAKWSALASYNNTTDSLPSEDSTLKFPAAFSNLKLPCGWSGPYITSRNGKLLDGWNNDWLILNSAGTEISPVLNSFIHGIKSLGSNSDTSEDDWSSKNQIFKFTPGYATLIVTFMVRDTSGNSPLLRSAVAEEDISSIADWAVGNYSAGQKVKSGGYVFICKTSGQSSASEPVFNKIYGAVTIDNQIEWQCIYPEPVHLNRLRVAIFSPCVTSTNRGIRRILVSRNGSSTETDRSESITTGTFFAGQPSEQITWIEYNQVQISNLIPGVKKLYAYGYYRIDASVFTNKRGSNVIEVKLKPGTNRINVFLTDEL